MIEEINICNRLVTIFNLTNTDKKLELPKNYDKTELKKVTDLAINSIGKVNNEYFDIWMSDKFQYMIWVRDNLSK